MQKRILLDGCSFTYGHLNADGTANLFNKLTTLIGQQ